MAQRKCTDAVHPTENRKSILDCCIKDIKNGNIVVYTKQGETYEIEAIAINYEGEYVDIQMNENVVSKIIAKNDPNNLYNGHNYDYYHKKYRSAKTLQNCGIGVTVAGLAIMTGGLIAAISIGVLSDTEYASKTMLVGFVTANFGTPFWIAGGMMKRNNKKAMNQFEKHPNLTFGLTNNGVGIVLNF